MSGQREALYVAEIHVGVRVLVGLMGLAMLLVALRFCWYAVVDREYALFAALPLVLGLLGLIGSAIFATEPVFGRAEGLEVREDGGWQTIPWSQVGPPGRPWWAFNPVFRVSSLPVAGRDKPVLFFSSKDKLRRLENLRAGAAVTR